MEQKEKKRVAPPGTFKSLPNPHDKAMEQAVLGAILIEKPALEVVIGFLKPEHFYFDSHCRIYEAIIEMTTKDLPIDILTVTQYMRAQGTLETAGGAYGITELTTRVNSAASIETHAKVLQQLYFSRELVINSVNTIRRVGEDEDCFEVMEDNAKFNFKIESQLHTNRITNIAETSLEVGRHMQNAAKSFDGITGLHTGIRGVDKPMAGIQPDLIYLAGRPGSGKTALMLNIARNISVDFKNPVAIFSLEMSKLSLTKRFHAMHTMIEGEKIKTGRLNDSEWSQYNSRIQSLMDAQIYIDDTAAINVIELRAKARKMVQTKGVKAIMIDYIQLIGSKRDKKSLIGNRHEELSYISKQLLAMKKELNVPVICLSQLSRGVEARSDKRPLISDMRESGSLEEDADIVLLLYRPSYYGIEATHPTTGESFGKDYTELIYGKFREGDTDTKALSFKLEFGKFTDYDETGFQGAVVDNKVINSIPLDSKWTQSKEDKDEEVPF